MKVSWGSVVGMVRHFSRQARRRSWHTQQRHRASAAHALDQPRLVLDTDNTESVSSDDSGASVDGVDLVPWMQDVLQLVRVRVREAEMRAAASMRSLMILCQNASSYDVTYGEDGFYSSLELAIHRGEVALEDVKRSRVVARCCEAYFAGRSDVDVVEEALSEQRNEDTFARFADVARQLRHEQTRANNANTFRRGVSDSVRYFRALSRGVLTC